MPSPYVESSGGTNRWMNVTKALEPVHLSLEVQNKKGQRPSAIDSESIKPLSVLHPELKREW